MCPNMRPQATAIEIDLSDREGVLTLEVSDNGPGMVRRRHAQGPLVWPAGPARARGQGGGLAGRQLLVRAVRPSFFRCLCVRALTTLPSIGDLLDDQSDFV